MDHGIREEAPSSPNFLTCVPTGSQVAICAAQIVFQVTTCELISDECDERLRSTGENSPIQ